MIHREAWYREVQGYLGEQETQGLDEDDFVHMKAPGSYPPYEENHPYSEEKDKQGGKEPFPESGGSESYPSLLDLYRTDPGSLRRILDLAYDKPDLFTQQRDPSDMFGLIVSPAVSLLIRRYVTDQPMDRSAEQILRFVEQGDFLK